MNSLIYQGEVSHVRQAPVQHSFRYPFYFYAFDIDELAGLARENVLFGYNQLRPVAIHDRDYLQPGSRPLREKLTLTLAELGVRESLGRAVMVTAARYFNYVFNPISFFYCYDQSGALLCVLVQVNNTFGEMHLYLLKDAADERVEGRLQFHSSKQFHVSPFFSRDGIYHFQLTEPEEHIDNRIHYYRDDQLALSARIYGQAEPLTGRSLLRTICKHPLTASLTMPRILWQAARLYWQRRLPVYTKPVPDHRMTIRPAPPGFLDRLGKVFALRHFSLLEQGDLELQLPEGESCRFGQKSARPHKLSVQENRLFRRVMLAGEIGFGEAYTAGEWTTDDLPGLLTMLAAHEELIDDRRVITATLGRWLNFLRHLLRANTIRGSLRNIREHYDLSNDFFAIFLDPSMTYSSALFNSTNESLEQAQMNKLLTIIAKCEIKEDDNVLEIGCGWGSFAIEAVRQTGCRVTGITLSKEQLALARARVRDAGLEDRIDLQLCDYRDVTGEYDKIVSIEMLEAVGHAGLKPFFSVCDRTLRPGGKVVIQVITIPDRKYNAYRYRSDWIRKHIFPGGHLPSVGSLCKALASSSLDLNKLDNYGLNYAKTLDLWRQTLLVRQETVLAMGYDKNFLRKWDYYFAYCQAGFATRIIDLTQLVLDKPGRG